jgi:PleD family two-component response regulator
LPEEKGIHVYVVDDEITISETLALILSKRGFTVSSFTDPLKALNGVLSRSPDVLLKRGDASHTVVRAELHTGLGPHHALVLTRGLPGF